MVLTRILGPPAGMSWLGGSVVLSAWPKGRARNPFFHSVPPQPQSARSQLIMLNWGDWYFRACGPWLTLCVEGSAGTMKFWQNLSMTTTALQPRQLANWPAQWCNLIVGICCFCHVYKNSPFFILQNSKPFRSHKAERLQEEKLEESFQKKNVETSKLLWHEESPLTHLRNRAPRARIPSHTTHLESSTLDRISVTSRVTTFLSFGNIWMGER